MEKIADRNSWKNTPLPSQRARLDVKRVFSHEEYRLLCKGVIPEVMEDKWFIFMENDVLYFHRSWTGHCIYEVHFDNRQTVCEAWVNRDSNSYKETDTVYDKKLLLFLIDNLLLGKNTSFPMPTALSEKLPTGIQQHTFSGTGYPETPYPDKSSFMEKIKRVFGRKK